MNNISKESNFSELIEKMVNSKSLEKEFGKIKNLNDLYNLFKSKNYKGDYNCWINDLQNSFKEFSGKINLSEKELELLAAGKSNSLLKYSAPLLASLQVLAPMTSTQAMTSTQNQSMVEKLFHSLHSTVSYANKVLPAADFNEKIEKNKIESDMSGSVSKKVIEVFSSYKNLKHIINEVNKIGKNNIPNKGRALTSILDENNWKECNEFINDYEKIVGLPVIDDSINNFNPYLYDVLCKDKLFKNMKDSGGDWELLKKLNNLTKKVKLYDSKMKTYFQESVVGFTRITRLNGREFELAFPAQFTIGDSLIQEGFIFKLSSSLSLKSIKTLDNLAYTIPEPDNEASILLSATMEKWMLNYHNHCVDKNPSCEFKFSKDTQFCNYYKDNIKSFTHPCGYNFNIPFEVHQGGLGTSSTPEEKELYAFRFDASKLWIWNRPNQNIFLICCRNTFNEVNQLFNKVNK